MNDKFYQLPIEKQNLIINAGFKVFSENSYKHSPVSEIALEAGISKSLLFFYFKNKLDLYIFLWNKSMEITQKYLDDYKVFDEEDLFSSMLAGTKAKIQLMKTYPLISTFSMKAFYETEPAVKEVIQESYKQEISKKQKKTNAVFDMKEFKDGIDINMMFKEMYWAGEGFLWEKMQKGEFDADKLEEEFTKLISFWKSVYLK